jgi:hypothetical protein
MIDPNTLQLIDDVVTAAMKSFVGPIIVTPSQAADGAFMALLRGAYPAAEFVISPEEEKPMMAQDDLAPALAVSLAELLEALEMVGMDDDRDWPHDPNGALITRAQAALEAWREAQEAGRAKRSPHSP